MSASGRLQCFTALRRLWVVSIWSSVDYFRSSPGNGHREGRSLCLPDDEDAAVPVTRRQRFKRKLADIWSSAVSERTARLAQSSAFDDDEVGIRILLADRFRFLILGAPVAGHCRFAIGELHDDVPLARVAFHQFDLAATHDELRAEFLEGRPCRGQVVRVAFGLTNADAHDPVGFGHGQSPCSGLGDGQHGGWLSRVAKEATAAINVANAARMAAACATRASRMSFSFIAE